MKKLEIPCKEDNKFQKMCKKNNSKTFNNKRYF